MNRILFTGLVLLAAVAASAAVLWLGAGGQRGAARAAVEPARPPAAEEVRVQAIGPLQGLTPAERRALDPRGFAPMDEPGPSEWLAVHPEPGQTFAEYVASDPHQPTAERRRIVLQPIGSFAAELAPALDDLRACAAAYFGLEVVLRQAVDWRGAGISARRNPLTHNRQLLAPDILAWLRGRLPDDAFCLLGITMQDLYPEPSWNFVFGMASLRERVGVFSFARYDPAFYGRQAGAAAAATMLRRSCKVLAHETGHMFGLRHCIHFQCGMNGSNHLAESDSRPIHLCPICLRKLQHAVGFDHVARYRALEAFYQRVGLKPEAAWVRRRLAFIEGGRGSPGAAGGDEQAAPGSEN